jgi:hypothetical protein
VLAVARVTLVTAFCRLRRMTASMSPARRFADDLTDESAARLQAVVDGTDGYEWGGLA